MSEKFEGTVIWFNAKPGYGFIEWNKNGVKQEDMFVHFSDIVSEPGSFRTLKKGQVVSFGLGTNNRGEPKAVEIVVISG